MNVNGSTKNALLYMQAPMSNEHCEQFWKYHIGLEEKDCRNISNCSLSSAK